MYSGLCCLCVLLQLSGRQLVVLLFFFLMFVSELVLEEAEFTPDLCSREGGTWLTGKGLYQRRAFV